MLTRIIAVTAHKPGLHSKFVRRLEHVRTSLMPSLRAIGLNPEIFPAILGSSVRVENGFAKFEGLSIPLGQGCTGNLLSNYKLWSFSVTSGQPVLILEDDASLPESHRQHVSRAIKSFLEEPKRCDILYLLGKSPYIKDGLKHYGPNQIAQIDSNISRLLRTEDLACTAAYMVTPASAKVLMGRIDRFKTTPTDGYVHTAFRAGEIGVVVQNEPEKGFMLNDNWAEWNHKHDPSLVVQ